MKTMGKKGEVAGVDGRRPSSPANMPPIFYRMIVSSVIHDKKLRIPGKFVKKLGNELPAVATLTTPNGCVWQVGLKKMDDKVWFTDGWHEFVKHQSICVGYLLFFTYVGNSNFVVNVYDLGTAEINYQCHAMGSSEGWGCGNRCQVLYKKEAEDDDKVEILENKVLDENVDQQKLGEGCNASYVQYKGRNFNGIELKSSRYAANGGNLRVGSVLSVERSTRDVGIQCGNIELKTSAYETRLHYLSQIPKISRKRNRGIGDESRVSAKHKSESPAPGSETSCGTFLRRWRVVKPEEKERVLNESKMFQSQNPFCRVIMRHSYVYKGIGLHMPSSFAEKYLGGVLGFIALQVPNGGKWPVRCMWSNGSAKLSKGWPEFVRDNMLDEGDVCVFELIKMGEIVLKVTIFHVVEDADPVNQIPTKNLLQVGQLGNGYDLNG
ncbi:B3 domain-containing transcription factor [Actinidia chinensis var. chinensis]|uniref:B3 domain-containing transcription factor n=1 Tax=Actinidia chinensis var. chinensis TaxID=1590841 RepID=A0A2R6RHA8_ACTCC|nr:B3 domain-containing transcription factor [Actinidia chinensis var. chinensis]